MPRNPINVIKRPNELGIIPKFSMILLFGPICLCKKFKAGEGSVCMLFRTQRWNVPSWNHEPSWEKLRFARSLFQFSQKITTACWCHVMAPCQVSWFSSDFRIYMNLKTKYLNVSNRPTMLRCFKFIPILAWDLNIHPRTHIWFFNSFRCTGAWACSSNLNYAH